MYVLADLVLPRRDTRHHLDRLLYIADNTKRGLRETVFDDVRRRQGWVRSCAAAAWPAAGAAGTAAAWAAEEGGGA